MFKYYKYIYSHINTPQQTTTTLINMYTLTVKDRDYQTWHIDPLPEILTSSKTATGNFPIDHKLFHGDVFTLNYELGKCVVLDSPLKQQQNIPGILILENNRSYGRTNNKKRLLYRCKPHNPSYPHFLVPYEIPMGFNKNFRNKYVTFKYDSWEDKHPRGILSQTLGDTDDLDAYYEYQLFCRELHQPITKCIQQCKAKIHENPRDAWIQHILSTPNQYGNIIRDNNPYIFAIDPEDCTDRDDALSVRRVDDTYTIVTVYIANVWVWIEAFDLWDYIGSRMSTIYLPNKKRSMLPSILTEDICSLDAGKTCFVMAMDFHIQNNQLTWDPPRQKLIHVQKQFHYEDPKLAKYPGFRALETVTKQLSPTVGDSHDVVAYWMTQMNTAMAGLMRQKEIGIFRVVSSTTNTLPSTTTTHTTSPLITSPQTTPKSMESFLRIWEQKLSGKYSLFHPTMDYHHCIMNISEYVHFTSPIRRMIDLLNHLLWLSTQFELPSKCKVFVEQCEYQIESINRQYKQIKKVQNDCQILYQVTTHPELLEQLMDACVLECIGENIYSVYVEELKWIGKLYSEEVLEIYQPVMIQLYVFVKEEQLQKKIRIQKYIQR